jgi:hypothetical protein
MSAASEPPPGPARDDSPNEPRLRPFVEAFVRNGIEFLVIGGQAEYLMGGARLTFDTDFCYRRTLTNLERVAAALKELRVTLRGAPADLPFRIDAVSLALGSNFTFSTDHGSFDLLGWVEPIGDYDTLLAGCETIDFRGDAVRTIGLADLIRVKEHIRRQKDQRSLEQLYAIRRQRERKG